MCTSLARRIAACALALGLAVMPDADAAELTFELRIENGRVAQNMRRIRVQRNDVVKLKWTSDKAMSIHLHGYDIEKQVVPGAVTEMMFTARATGRFTIEPHLAKPSGGHAHGEPLVTIEVHP